MYAFLSSTVNRLQPVQTNSVMCSSKRFFISEKPKVQLTVWFFCGSVQFSCSFFQLRELDFQTLATWPMKTPTVMILQILTSNSHHAGWQVNAGETHKINLLRVQEIICRPNTRYEKVVTTEWNQMPVTKAYWYIQKSKREKRLVHHWIIIFCSLSFTFPWKQSSHLKLTKEEAILNRLVVAKSNESMSNMNSFFWCIGEEKGSGKQFIIC